MSADDVPIDLFRAVEHANRIIDWQENLLPEEMPPPWMWHLDFELVDWFKSVEFKRKEKWGSQGGSSDNDEDGWQTNDYARGRR